MAKARQMIFGASFNPETLDMLGRVLDEVWSSVRPLFGDDAREIETARTRLAMIVIELARDGQFGPLEIARIASRLMRDTARNRV